VVRVNDGNENTEVEGFTVIHNVVYLPVHFDRGTNDFLGEIIRTNVTTHGNGIAARFLDFVNDRLCLCPIEAKSHGSSGYKIVCLRCSVLTR
jgi:hypothetical protein